MNRSHLTSWNRNRSMYLKLGLVISLTICLSLINLEVFPSRCGEVSDAMDDQTFEFVEEKIHSIKEEYKIQPVIKKLIKTMTLVNLEKINHSPSTTSAIEAPLLTQHYSNSNLKSSQSVVASTFLKPTISKVDSVLVLSDQMPYLSSCAHLESEAEIRLCTHKKILEFIQSHVKYPPQAREIGIEGTVLVSFTVSKTGQLKNIHLINDIGGGCGNEAITAISALEGWKPGRHRQQTVNVKMTVPIKFQLMN